MKKIFEKPTLKKILFVLAVLFIIILAPITMPLMFLGGCFGIWRFTKRKLNIRKRNIAIAVIIIGILGSYAVGKLTPDVIKEQTEQTQVTKFTWLFVNCSGLMSANIWRGPNWFSPF